MTRWTVFLTLALFCLIVTPGCNSGAVNPVIPGPEAGVTSGTDPHAGQSTTHLWGYYEIAIDIESLTVDVVASRSAMFSANVVNFLNGSPAGLSFHINETPIGTDYIDVDIDIAMTHPFPGLPQYNGYDVRGIFMGDGSLSMAYNGDLDYPALGTDQFMLPDPDDGDGGPDGYSRWFNFSEFNGGMPLLEYTQGNIATPGFSGTATLCPYKSFADGLGPTESLWAWLGGNPDQFARFSSGATNHRNYYLRFPNAKGVVFGYAIVANWEGNEPEYHPSNAHEAVAVDVLDQSDLWYIDDTQNGGQINLDISIWDWDSTINNGVMEDYQIIIESCVLSATCEFTIPEMTPIGGTDHYSTYHVEIEADDVGGIEGAEYWVIVEQQNYDYSNDMGVMNSAWDDPLASFFRFDLHVSSSPSNLDPVCDLVIDDETPMPIEDFWPIEVKFDATGSYDPDLDPLTYEWDFDGDGVYDEDPDDNYTGDVDNPSHLYTEDPAGDAYLRLTDGNGGESECSVPLDLTGHESKNIPLRPGYDAVDIGIDPADGDIWIVYSDARVYHYTLDQWYQDESYAYQASLYGTVLYMDTASGGYSVFVYTTNPNGGSIYVYSPTGNMQNGGGWGSAGGPYFWCDALAYGETGPDANDLTFLVGALNSSGAQYDMYMREWAYPYAFSNTKYFVSYSFPLTPVTGYNRIFHEYVQGLDTDTNGSTFWALEAPDYYCAAFNKSPYASWYILSYANSYFGTGTEETGDTCWTADVRDLGRDNDGRFHVLDNVSGTPAVKVFTGSASGGTSYGHYGDSVTIEGEPQRIDGNDYDGNMVVLHGDSVDGFMISVFKQVEMPE